MRRLHTELSVKVPALAFLSTNNKQLIVDPRSKGNESEVKRKWKSKQTTKTKFTHTYVRSGAYTHTYTLNRFILSGDNGVPFVCLRLTQACLLWIFIYALVLQASQDQHIHTTTLTKTDETCK